MDEEQKQKMISERIETEAVCRRLEEKFNDHGLKFTRDIAGSHPVQAFGLLHGMRFYFRFRHDHAELRVGLVDVEGNKEIYRRNMESWLDEQEELTAKVKSGDKEAERDLLFHEIAMPKLEDPTGPEAFPSLIKKLAYKNNVKGEEYAGDLTPVEAEELFTELMKNLRYINWNWGVEPFPEDEWNLNRR